MFQLRDMSLFLPSPNAARSFRRLRQFDYAVNASLILLAVLAVFNLIDLLRLKAIENQDFAEISSIRESTSTRLIWVVAAIAIGLMAWREVKYGERSLGLVYPGMGVFFFLLVPAVMTEIEPPKETQMLQVIRRECAPANMGPDNKVAWPADCNPVAVHEGDILLASSDPRENEVSLLPMARAAQNTATWYVDGRGKYTVYFMLKYPDMGACQDAVVFHHHYGLTPGQQNSCMDWQGSAWLIWPHNTSANSVSNIPLISHTEPELPCPTATFPGVHRSECG